MSKAVTGKPRLLFVGGFSVGHDGLTGGTYMACKQLADGPLGEAFALVKVDTSQVTERSRALWHRLSSGAVRFARVAWMAFAGGIDRALIFVTIGPSWIERGMMALSCRAAGIPAFLFPRSGEINNEIDAHILLRQFTRILVKSGVRFIFQGSAIRQRFLAMFPDARQQSYVIGNWIDLSWRDGVAPLPSKQPVVILYMGWLHPWKGVDVLIDALGRHAHRFRDAKFVICGDGYQRAALEEAAARTGLDIEFRGWVHGEDKMRAFSDAQIVVLASRIEGMPNVLLEAMSVGRPVVATSVGGVPDLVEDGVDGLVVPSEDPNALAAAIAVLVDDSRLRATFGAAGKVKIERDHDLGVASRKLVTLLAVPAEAT